MVKKKSFAKNRKKEKRLITVQKKKKYPQVAAQQVSRSKIKLEREKRMKKTGKQPLASKTVLGKKSLGKRNARQKRITRCNS